jgi:hypothetical protein
VTLDPKLWTLIGAIIGAVFGAGVAWARQIWQASSTAEGLKEMAAVVAKLPTAESLQNLRDAFTRAEAGLRGEVARVETQVAALARHVGDLREEVAEQRGRTRSRAKE